MAKKLKEAAGSAEKIAGMKPVRLDRLITDINRAAQKKNDATTNHASIWKEAKDAGCHTEALKLALKLDKMEDDKRNDFLRSFDQLRGHMDLNRALDLFEAASEQDNAAAEPAQAAADTQDWQGEGEPIGESGEIVHADPEQVAAEAPEGDDEAETEAPAHWADADLPEDQTPDNAGALYNAGVEARRQGLSLDDFDGEHGSPESLCWAKGWKATDAEMGEAAEPTPAEEVDGMGYTERAELQGEDEGHAEADPYADGRAACIEGRDEDANPHDEGTDAHALWLSGHRDAFETGAADAAPSESLPAEDDDSGLEFGSGDEGGGNVTQFPQPAEAEAEAEPEKPKRRRRAAAASKFDEGAAYSV